MKKTMMFIGIILALFFWVKVSMMKMNIEGVAIMTLEEAGMQFVEHVAGEGDITFPRDDGSTEAEQLAFLREQWREILLLVEGEYRSQRSKYYDASIWTVIKNLPENPPENLVVLATRNIDPSSLRTRLTEGDAEKQIRIDEHFAPPENLPILKKAAVVIYANGGRLIIGTAPGNDHTCRRVYWRYLAKEPAPFDLTTNLVSDQQVKYLTTDGEVIPAND